MQLLSAEKETWLAGDVRRLTLKIAAPSVAAMVVFPPFAVCLKR